MLISAIALWQWGGHGRRGTKDSAGKPVERETSTWVMLEMEQRTVCKANTQAALRLCLHLCVLRLTSQLSNSVLCSIFFSPDFKKQGGTKPTGTQLLRGP